MVLKNGCNQWNGNNTSDLTKLHLHMYKLRKLMHSMQCYKLSVVLKDNLTGEPIYRMLKDVKHAYYLKQRNECEKFQHDRGAKY